MNNPFEFKLKDILNTTLDDTVNDELELLKEQYNDQGVIENESKKRNIKYTILINTYIEYIKETVNFKRSARLVSFIVFISVFLIVLLLSLGVTISIILDQSYKIQDIISLLSASITFVSTIVVLPQKILQFVFNENEDAYIVDIIRNTQDYDRQMPK